METFKHSIRFQAILLCAAIFLNPISCSQEKKLLFVFGDSLFDPCNNQYLGQKSPAYFWPYGMSLNNHSTCRFSDGLLVPDFIAQFAGLNILPPFMQPNASFSDGANFASAGAGVLNNTNSDFKVMDLRTQLDDFKKVVSLMVENIGEANAKSILMRSVFLFSFGGNDYFSFNTNYPNASETERRNYMHMVLGNLTNGFKELYGIGLRKLAIQNVGPLGCYPMIKSNYSELNGSCARRFSEHANQHNKALSVVLKKLETTLPWLKYSIMDYYHVLGDRLKNPTKYDTACCGSGLYNGENCGTSPFNICSNPKVYVFFDGGHSTMKTNHQLAQLIWSGVPNITAPYNMKQLFDFA